MSPSRAVCLVLLLASCSSEVPPPTGKVLDLGSRSAAFAFRFHGEMLRRNEGRNVFVSPASVLFALSMATSGARGETAEEMLSALELKGWKREDLDAACAGLLPWLEGGEPAVQLNVANSAWMRQKYPFEPSYVKTLETDYHAQARAVDFDDPKTLDVINRWVQDRTQGRIAKAGPDRIEPLDALFLINAVYFKGGWTRKFEKALTHDQPFKLGNGKTKTLPFMRRKARYSYAETTDYQAIQIPYGEKGRTAFYVVLPREGMSLRQLHDQLAAKGSKWNVDLIMHEVDLELPRFKLEFGAELRPVLSEMGMKKAFGRADFTGMSPRGRELYVSAVHHKTYVDINEEGTEAAAVTTVGVGAKSAEFEKFVLKVDRPFFCAIVDHTTGTILFTGSIVEP